MCEKGCMQRDVNKINSRRSFLKLCSGIAAVLGLETVTAQQVAAAFLRGNKPPVIWLHFAECTGCTESTLRVTKPWFDDLILNTISLEYHETLMAGAGATVDKIRSDAARKYAGQFFCVVEGSVPTASNGIFGTINGRTMLSIAQEICSQAKAVIALGTCASYGGLAAAAPNPTGAKGISDALPNLTVPVINCPGCPPNSVNFISIFANYLLTGALPPLDAKKRPLFAYGRTNHAQCPYEDKRQEDRCMEDEGCKGPRTYNNCPRVKFNEGTSFPMQVGHPCIGCSEPNFWDVNTPFYRRYHCDNSTQIGPPDVSPVSVQNNLNVPGEMYDLRGRKLGTVHADLSQTTINKEIHSPSGIRLLRNRKKTIKKMNLH